MILNIEEVLNIAIMTSTPCVIVEGIDDIAIYEAVAREMSREIEITAVETLAEAHFPVEAFYQEGCEGVISAITNLNTILSTVHNPEKYIVGIIDRDVREFRKDLPVISSLLALNMYSIESHFVCENVFEKLIDHATATEPHYLGVVARADMFATVKAELFDYYYFSLESLKLAMDPSYVADFQYSYGGEAKNQSVLRKKVLDKSDQLDIFAGQIGVSHDMESLRRIVKGKWLYQGFCRAIFNAVSTLKLTCGMKDAVQCQYCFIGKNDKCMYGVKHGISPLSIAAVGLKIVSTPNLDYVRDRFDLLVSPV